MQRREWERSQAAWAHWLPVVRPQVVERARRALVGWVEVSCLEKLAEWFQEWAARWQAPGAAALRQALRARSTVCRRLLRVRVVEAAELWLLIRLL